MTTQCCDTDTVFQVYCTSLSIIQLASVQLRLIVKTKSLSLSKMRRVYCGMEHLNGILQYLLNYVVTYIGTLRIAVLAYGLSTCIPREGI